LVVGVVVVLQKAWVVWSGDDVRGTRRLGWWVPVQGPRMCLEMESRFFVEAKTFVFSVVDGKSDLWVEERRKGFSGAVCLGSLCIVWLVSKMEWVLRNTGVEDFVESFREGSKAVIVRRGRNKAGRFLEVAVYAKGGRKGMVLFPEGRAGWGWSRVSG
jgi:hypothetical protein